MRHSTKKALGCASFFALVGIIGWITFVTNVFVALPLGIFYAVLVVNTYYSIKLFAHIAAKDDLINNVLDLLLVGLYCAMSIFLNDPQVFVFLDLILFIVACAKYTFLLKIVDHHHAIKKKILVDISGTMMCTLALGGVLAGYATISTWALALVFVIANIFVLFVWPLYTLEGLD